MPHELIPRQEAHALRQLGKTWPEVTKALNQKYKKNWQTGSVGQATRLYQQYGEAYRRKR